MAKKIKFAFKLKPDKKTTRILIIFLAVFAFTALLFNLKHFFVAAMVNGRPIARYTLDRQLEKQMGKQVLEGLISQILVRQEAKQQGIKIGQEAIEEKISQIEVQLEGQGQKLDSLLTAQGQTRKDLEEQIELQLMIEEILGKQISLGDEELKDYFEKNKEQFPEGTTFENQKEDLKEQLRQQKIGEKFQPWLTELKEKAKIDYFLKL